MRAKLLFFGTPAVWEEDGGHLKQHDVCCLLFLLHFSLIPAPKIYGSISAWDFSKGDNLSTPHRQPPSPFVCCSHSRCAPLVFMRYFNFLPALPFLLLRHKLTPARDTLPLGMRKPGEEVCF